MNQDNIFEAENRIQNSLHFQEAALYNRFFVDGNRVRFGNVRAWNDSKAKPLGLGYAQATVVVVWSDKSADLADALNACLADVYRDLEVQARTCVLEAQTKQSTALAEGKAR